MSVLKCDWRLGTNEAGQYVVRLLDDSEPAECPDFQVTHATDRSPNVCNPISPSSIDDSCSPVQDMAEESTSPAEDPAGSQPSEQAQSPPRKSKALLWTPFRQDDNVALETLPLGFNDVAQHACLYGQ